VKQHSTLRSIRFDWQEDYTYVSLNQNKTHIRNARTSYTRIKYVTHACIQNVECSVC